jgi:hypothetical protein
MSVQTHKAILQGGAESFNVPSDRSGWIDIHHPDVVAHGLAPEPLDRDGVQAFYSALWSAFPDLTISVEDMIGEGDKLSWRLSVEGTHECEVRRAVPLPLSRRFDRRALDELRSTRRPGSARCYPEPRLKLFAMR